MPEDTEAADGVSQPERSGFFVYVVESPSPVDIYHGRSEGGIVAQAVALDGTPSVVRTAINPDAFVAALRIGLPQAMKEYPDKFPLLHLSAHGGPDGIQLSSGDIIEWAQLRTLITPINQSLQGHLILCMSACEGYSACRMAMGLGSDPHPYFAMIGHCGTPTWSDTAISYLVFYHLVAKGTHPVEAVEAMKAASGDAGWIVETAQETKKSFLEAVMKELSLGAAQRELEGVAEKEELPQGAKALDGEPHA